MTAPSLSSGPVLALLLACTMFTQHLSSAMGANASTKTVLRAQERLQQRVTQVVSSASVEEAFAQKKRLFKQRVTVRFQPDTVDASVPLQAWSFVIGEFPDWVQIGMEGDKVHVGFDDRAIRNTVLARISGILPEPHTAIAWNMREDAAVTRAQVICKPKAG